MVQSSSVSTDTPTVSDFEAVREQYESGEVDTVYPGGTKLGIEFHDTLATLYEDRGAVRDGEWVIVEWATITGVASDGETIQGEAQVRRSPYHDPEVVSFEELELPSRTYVRSLNWGRRDYTSVPGYYEQAIDLKEDIADACPIDIYCSSVSPAWGWRWKLQSYYECRPAVGESCETLMIDSGANRWGSPEDVLSAAADTDADLVMATDVTGMEFPYSCPVAYCSEKFHEEDALRRHLTEADGRHSGLDGDELPPEYEDSLATKGHNFEMPTTDDSEIDSQQDAAIEGIRRFMDRARELEILDRTILPIQPPYLNFLERVDWLGWLDEVDYVAVGGMLTIPDVQDRIEALHTVREYAGEEMHIHALAPGTEPLMLRELQANPSLIDSLDISTPEQAPAKDKLPDATWSQHDHVFPRGEKSGAVRKQFTAGVVLQLAQMLSPLCKAEETFDMIAEKKEDDADPRLDNTQQQISQWAGDD